jgi:prevent-host-death family protein
MRSCDLPQSVTLSDTNVKRVSIKQLHAETGRLIREAAQAPFEVTDRGKPIAVVSPVRQPDRDLFDRIRALRGSMVLPKGETVKDLINAGRRI